MLGIKSLLSDIFIKLVIKVKIGNKNIHSNIIALDFLKFSFKNLKLNQLVKFITHSLHLINKYLFQSQIQII